MHPQRGMEITAQLLGPIGDGLSPRECEVVRHVALGLRNAEVGATLLISENTVRKHLQNVFVKLGLRRRTQLAGYALRVGLV